MTDPKTNDLVYQHSLEVIADYERKVRASERLADADTLDVASHLDWLFHDPDGRWIAERNAERAATAKTERGGRPVEPDSRSQFSTWLRGRFNGIAPSTTYRLLDAHEIASEFLRHGEITPTTEAQLRPLKSLRNVAHGSGARIQPVWEIACELAGNQQPTREQVRKAIAIWNERNLPRNASRRENIEDRLRRKRYRADWVVDDLLIVAKSNPDLAEIIEEQLEEILERTRKDLEEVRALRVRH